MDERVVRRRRAKAACDRILSGVREPRLSERLSTLAAAKWLTADNVPAGGAEPDVYGTGGPVTVLEDRVAALLGTQAALFFPTGTMAQQVALRCWAGRTGNPTIATHPLAHPEVHERHAYAVLTGLHTVWPTRQPRQPTAAEVRGLEEPFGTLLLELPLRDAGYLLPTWEELSAVVAAARARGARVHFDGARLWESTTYLGRDLAEIAALADSVYVSFYKTLGGISGAALAGPTDLIAQARAWRHRYGGQLFQQWPAALAALVGLDDVLPRLPAYVRHARTVAACLAQVPGARVHPDPPHTHQFQWLLPYGAEALDDAALRLAESERTWLCAGWTQAAPGYAMAEITVAEPALSWTATDVERATATFLGYLDSAADPSGRSVRA
jgi:threonine aldolase